MCARRGTALPASIANAPELLLGLELYWSTFWLLCSSRASAWGVGSLPWAVISDYAAYLELSEEELEDFIHLIRKMDEAFVDYHNKDAAEKAKEKAKANGQPSAV